MGHALDFLIPGIIDRGDTVRLLCCLLIQSLFLLSTISTPARFPRQALHDWMNGLRNSRDAFNWPHFQHRLDFSTSWVSSRCAKNLLSGQIFALPGQSSQTLAWSSWGSVYKLDDRHLPIFLSTSTRLASGYLPVSGQILSLPKIYYIILHIVVESQEILNILLKRSGASWRRGTYE